MNAQEALDDLRQTLYADETIGLNLYNYIENRLEPLQQLIDQADANPKRLEELGWEADGRFTVVAYTKDNTYHNTCSILFVEERKEIETWGDCSLSHEEILAIAEKMKELGMTGDQSPKEN